MRRIMAGTLACAAFVPLLTSCAKRTQRNEGATVALNAAPVVKETGATVRNAIMGASANGPAATTISRQMDKQAQELAFELPGAVVQRLGGGIVLTLPEGMLFRAALVRRSVVTVGDRWAGYRADHRRLAGA